MVQRVPPQKLREGLLVLLVFAASVTLTRCEGLLGANPRASSSQAPQQNSATSTNPQEGLSEYADKCQSCHGPYADLTTPDGLKLGKLASASAHTIKESCPKLPLLTGQELQRIVKALARIKPVDAIETAKQRPLPANQAPLPQQVPPGPTPPTSPSGDPVTVLQ